MDFSAIRVSFRRDPIFPGIVTIVAECYFKPNISQYSKNIIELVVISKVYELYELALKDGATYCVTDNFHPSVAKDRITVFGSVCFADTASKQKFYNDIKDVYS